MGGARPVSAGERIGAIDTLRGVAVLGILVMNIYAFAMPFIAYMNPLAMGGLEWYNLGTWFVTHVFFDQKFLTIFALLFGAGLVIMWERANARGTPLGPIYFRRQLWLLVIGAVHGYLLWFGDILFSYAVMGMLVYFLRSLRPNTLIFIACCMLPIGPLVSFGGALYVEELQGEIAEIDALIEVGRELDEEQTAKKEEWDSIASFVAPSEEDVQEELSTYRNGYLGIVAYRAPLVATMQSQNTIFFMLWRVAALMLIGMAFMKLGILSGKRDAHWYRRMMITGYGLGLPVVIAGSLNLYAHEFDGIYMMRIGLLPNYVGSVLVSFGHVALVMLFVKAGRWPSLMARFAAVGRMALTNYLLHSVVMTTIFYGYGLGLFGEVPRLKQMAFVVALLAVQLWLCPIWLRVFRFGPAEWLWRSLSYARVQPMRRGA